VGELTYYPQHADVEKRFVVDVSEHVLTVCADYALHKHLLFKAPGDSAFWFEFITWPGGLTVSGDMGTFTFRREQDMLRFFEGSAGIDLRYWAEKVQGSSGVETYSERLFREHVQQDYEEHIQDDPGASHLHELWEQITESVLDLASYGEREAMDAAMNFRGAGSFRFDDAWEWCIRDYTYRFVWVCLAIRWGIAKYRTEGGV